MKRLVAAALTLACFAVLAIPAHAEPLFIPDTASIDVTLRPFGSGGGFPHHYDVTAVGCTDNRWHFEGTGHIPPTGPPYYYTETISGYVEYGTPIMLTYTATSVEYGMAYTFVGTHDPDTGAIVNTGGSLPAGWFTGTLTQDGFDRNHSDWVRAAENPAAAAKDCIGKPVPSNSSH